MKKRIMVQKRIRMRFTIKGVVSESVESVLF